MPDNRLLPPPRASVITEQAKITPHNGGEPRQFFNSRQPSVSNKVSEVAERECEVVRNLKEEHKGEFPVSGGVNVGIPREVTRPITESAALSSIPRTHTAHLSGWFSLVIDKLSKEQYTYQG